ncbi:MAG: tRNA uridine-5-carboxymethylaminomethyl(34) synthesis GTPase MnmE [Kiritimatiellae bacterium]|nr:tRNA uridine-5-carboxymethylaminomethyl(34) synthesis GTPase MnmE [Kiritimatiellia bacterium]
MNTADDTIAAIATAAGEGGISIVRISGARALPIADALFRGAGPKPSQRPSHVVLHGHITCKDPEGRATPSAFAARRRPAEPRLGGPPASPGEALRAGTPRPTSHHSGHPDVDEVLLVIMRAPHTYTREDVVEIQGHGGQVAARRILRRVLDAGARLAEPGEFTRRAFLNGRLDLLQAEAVLDLVRARSDRAAAAALEQLDGALSAKFNQLYEELLAAAADLEATLDFPEEDVPQAILDTLPARLDSASTQIASLLAMWDEGKLLREGALVVIAGRPNVGKSTMLNALLGMPRAIVSCMPGTTRDTIEEGLVLDGIPVRLVDTAGLRDVACEVEREGVQRAREHIRRADIHIYMIDASQPLAKDDEGHVTLLDPARSVIVLNKTDLGRALTASRLPGYTAVETSLTQGVGVQLVRDALRSKLEADLDLSVPPHAVISERHRRLLLEANATIREARELLAEGRDDFAVLVAERLRTAIESIGQATGRSLDEGLLDAVFSRFCIGK